MIAYTITSFVIAYLITSFVPEIQIEGFVNANLIMLSAKGCISIHHIIADCIFDFIITVWAGFSSI